MTKVLILYGGRSAGRLSALIAAAMERAQVEVVRMHIDDYKCREEPVQVLHDDVAEVDLAAWLKLGTKDQPVHAAPQRRAAQWKHERNAHKRYWR